MWKPIETAPRDRKILVKAPGVQDLPTIICYCQWHPEAGFCVDEIRNVTEWCPTQPYKENDNKESS